MTATDANDAGPGIADLNMDGVIGLIDRLLMGSAMVEFVPVKALR